MPAESGSSRISERFPLSLLLFNQAIFIRSLLRQARCHSFHYRSGINGNNAAAELGDRRAPRQGKHELHTLSASAGRRRGFGCKARPRDVTEILGKTPGTSACSRPHIHRHSPAMLRLNTCVQKEAVSCFFFLFLCGTTPLTLCKTNTWG